MAQCTAGPSAVEDDSGTQQQQQLAYPVSATGACPTCGSRKVAYLVLAPVSAGGPGAPAPRMATKMSLVIEQLLQHGLAAYVRPEPDRETPSFSCLNCSFGFNLDWSQCSLERILQVHRASCRGPSCDPPAPVPASASAPHAAPDDAGGSSLAYELRLAAQQIADSLPAAPATPAEPPELVGYINPRTGRFQRIASEQHWAAHNLAPDREGRQMARYFDVGAFERDSAAATHKAPPLSKKEGQQRRMEQRTKRRKHRDAWLFKD